MLKSSQMLPTRLCLLLCALLGFGSAQAGSALTLRELLFNVDAVKLNIRNQVRDGCLSNFSAIRNRVMTRLQEKGFRIVDVADNSLSAQFVPTITLNMVGFANIKATGRQRCAVHMDVTLNAIHSVTVPHSGELADGPWRQRMYVDVPFAGSLLEGARERMQGRLESYAEQRVDQFALAVQGARNSVRQRAPKLWSQYQNRLAEP